MPRARNIGVVKKAPKLTKKDWSDVYDALMDAASMHHSGPKADRIVELAKKIRQSGVLGVIS